MFIIKTQCNIEAYTNKCNKIMAHIGQLLNKQNGETSKARNAVFQSSNLFFAAGNIVRET